MFARSLSPARSFPSYKGRPEHTSPTSYRTLDANQGSHSSHQIHQVPTNTGRVTGAELLTHHIPSGYLT